MLTREEEVWVRAYCAYVAGRNGYSVNESYARVNADLALRHFKETFPKTQENSK